MNLKQRELSKGNTPYKVSITCPNPECNKYITLDVPLNELEVKYLDEPEQLEYTTLDGKVLSLSYITPRMLDECTDKARDFQSEYPESGMSFEDLRTQELLRFVILAIDGKKPTPPQMTDFIQNMYTDDIDGVFEKLNNFDFGIQFVRETTCPKCGRKVKYVVPVG